MSEVRRRDARRLPLSLATYRLLTAALTPLAPTLLRRRLERGKELASRLGERRGEGKIDRPDGPLIWLHGASVGEMLAAVPLIGRVRARGFAVLVTTGTVTSAGIAGERLPEGVIHQFVPLDAPRFVAGFLDHWRPDLALFLESDLWPNLIMAAGRRGLPMILVNGRISERSHRRWRRSLRTIAALLQHFDHCLAQSVADAERLGELGAPRISVTGNLKLDVPEPPADPEKLAALKAALGDRPVIVAASTHPGEEAMIVDAHRRLRHSFKGLLTMIAPRHPERGPGVAGIATSAGLASALRSRGELPRDDTEIYVADTLGELGLIYRVAPVVFMGGSLVRHGGQNPVEPIKLGAAVLHGPHVWNFAELYAALDATRGAEEVSDAGRLAVRIGAWLTDPPTREAIAAAARQTAERLGGALERTLAALAPYLMQLEMHYGEQALDVAVTRALNDAAEKPAAKPRPPRRAQPAAEKPVAADPAAADAAPMPEAAADGPSPHAGSQPATPPADATSADAAAPQSTEAAPAAAKPSTDDHA